MSEESVQIDTSSGGGTSTISQSAGNQQEEEKISISTPASNSTPSKYTAVPNDATTRAKRLLDSIRERRKAIALNRIKQAQPVIIGSAAKQEQIEEKKSQPPEQRKNLYQSIAKTNNSIGKFTSGYIPRSRWGALRPANSLQH